MPDLIDSSEYVESIFSKTGLLSQKVKGFETREEQKSLALQVMEAYLFDKVLLAEAATGVGKSWAYLIPALLWAKIHRETTIISTHTIALQEQLIKKDIPFLLDLLDLDLQATLVKGMSNYFCFRKYEELSSESLLLTAEELEELRKLEQFAETSIEGSLSNVSFPVSSSMWEKVSAERGACSHVECPHFKKCFFFKARKQMNESQILVINHHLLIAELAARLRPDFQEEKSILPKTYRIILDEAHHLEEIALESFSIRIDRLDLVRYLGRIYSEFQPQKSRLGLFMVDLKKKKKMFSSALTLLFDVEIPGQKRAALECVEEFFAKVELFCETSLAKEQGSEMREKRWRFSSESAGLTVWQEEIREVFTRLQESFRRLFSLLDQLKKEALKDLIEADRESLSIHLISLEFTQSYLMQKLSELELFVLGSDDVSRVRWIEAAPSLAIKNITLVDARLNVADFLKKHLFESKQTAVLCSATLTSNRSFAFLKDQIGITGENFTKRTEEKTYDSPFDFERKSLFLVPKDLPLPHEFTFSEQSAHLIKEILKVSKGGCFVLFTSYEMLHFVYQKILASKDRPSLTYMKQGDSSKQLLIEQFKQKKDSVLFATSSFWEGIDVAGDALRCVILTKLPFKVPSNPLFQAMSELYEKQGKDPFSEYSLPQACLKFKQGFGRLIRTKTDRGCVVCLDKRIMTKPYGKVFLKSLPPCPIIHDTSAVMLQKMDRFYRSSEDDSNDFKSHL
jgi:ATP-dependent DNA helicase DinG